MYIIRERKTHTPLRRVVTFTQEKEQARLLYLFDTRAKAKHLMRNKGLEKREYEILFMTGKELERLA